MVAKNLKVGVEQRPVYFVEELPDEIQADNVAIIQAKQQGWLMNNYYDENDRLELVLTFENGRAVYVFTHIIGKYNGVVTGNYTLEEWEPK